MAGSLTLVLGAAGTWSAVLTCLNLDSSVAEGVAINYTSDNASVATVDPASGALTPVAGGVATITGTGVRGSFTHSDSGTLTVTNENDGDFSAVLTFNKTS